MKLQKEIEFHGNWYKDACGAAFAMELVGERWTLLIVRELMLGGKRFSDIRASLPGISAKVLAERLERLDRLGIVHRHKLPPPAAAHVYQLTPWGYALEPVMQALARWALRSPLHDPTLRLSPVSFMLSLRTTLDPERAEAMDATVLFDVGDEQFIACLSNGEMPVSRAGDAEPAHDLRFSASSPSHFLGVFYGKRPAVECGVQVIGDTALAARFIDAFALPPKDIAPPGGG